MARPIDYDARGSLPSAEQRIATSTAQSAEALEEALALLRELHEHRVLHALVRLVRGADGLAFHGLEMLNEPGSVRAIRNLLELVKALGSIEPEALTTVTSAVAQGMREGARRVEAGERAGISDLLALSRDPDVGLALGALIGVLRGFGRALREEHTVPRVPHT